MLHGARCPGNPHLTPLCSPAPPQINAEKSPFLVEKLKIWMLPTLALVKHEKVVDYVVGFDDLGGKDDFPTEVLAARLASVEAIKWEGVAPARAASDAPQRAMRSGIYTGRTESDEDSDFDD